MSDFFNILLGAVSLAACDDRTKSSGTSDGATSADNNASPSPDGQSNAAGLVSAAVACNYISAAQLGAIEGARYAEPTVFNNKFCSWVRVNGEAITLSLTRNATAADWLTVLAGIKADQRAGEPTPIPGLGDRAAGVGLEIAVQHGTTIIDIRSADSEFGKWPKSTAIANAIIAGLH